jgi:hypothetical protein
MNGGRGLADKQSGERRGDDTYAVVHTGREEGRYDRVIPSLSSSCPELEI